MSPQTSTKGYSAADGLSPPGRYVSEEWVVQIAKGAVEVAEVAEVGVVFQLTGAPVATRTCSYAVGGEWKKLDAANGQERHVDLQK